MLPEATIAQRITRAKRTLSERGTPFEAPRGDELGPRLSSVLEVIYLLFNEGYSATAGEAWVRPDLCAEALRLGRMAAAMMPEEPEVHGLVALMELQASRLHARTDAQGRPVLLMDQDRSRWDRLLIRRGLAALDVSLRLAAEPGPYALQAMIAACHARVKPGEEVDWKRIAGLYGELLRVTPSPIVALNRAVAVGMAEGADAGLALLDEIAPAPSLAGYHLLPSVRGEFLRRLGRADEARAEFERAAGMTRNAQERELLLGRARACETGCD